ncbi:unnamed protein product [Meganyctiphanes norvegica]|uniref:Uncharacterized protein n=1 Tax=Meganyctiphanes norvegica TaxID=48144 RepID=A0AAV2RJ84_MEGNR
MYLDTKDFLVNVPAPGVEIHCLHGLGVQTVERMNFAAGKFPDSPTVIYGDGDGTVNKPSAQRCLQWNNTQKHRVYHETFKGVDHMAILRNEEPVNYIVNVIKKITAENQWELDMIKGLKKLTNGEDNKLQARIKEGTETKNDRNLEKNIEKFVVEVEERMHKNDFRLGKRFRKEVEEIEKKMENEYETIAVNVL